MKNAPRALLAVAVTLVLAGLGFADTLELKDGRVLHGKYLGGTQAILRFELNGEVQTFPTNEIVALTFTRGSGQAATAMPPTAPAAAPQSNMAPAPPSSVAVSTDSGAGNAGNSVTLPAG